MTNKACKSRHIAFLEQDGRCFYCGVCMWMHSPEELGVDKANSRAVLQLKCMAEHLVARSGGGGDDNSNIVAACLHCNSTRHKRKLPPSPEVYRQQIQVRVRRRSWHHRHVYALGLLGNQ